MVSTNNHSICNSVVALLGFKTCFWSCEIQHLLKIQRKHVGKRFPHVFVALTFFFFFGNGHDSIHATCMHFDATTSSYWQLISICPRHQRVLIGAFGVLCTTILYLLSRYILKNIIGPVSARDFGTYRISEQRMLRRVCAYAQTRQSLYCSHTHKMNVDDFSYQN